MTTALLARQVDVLITAGAVRDPSVSSYPIGAVARVAAVPLASPLGCVSEVRLQDFCELPMLYDPGLPLEFMEPFWLADVRPSREARLVSIVARDSRTVLEQVVRGTGVTVLLPWQVSTLPQGVRVLSLLGAAPTVLHAATRVGDHRRVVRALVDVLRAVLQRHATSGLPAA